MNTRLAHALVCLYPGGWRQRYGAEFEALLIAGPGLSIAANVVCSAAREHLCPARGFDLNATGGPLHLLSARAPWALFGLAPVLLLAGAYTIASLILLSGWRIFLPQASSPFVPVHGTAILYFGVGRLLYFIAPLLVGWGIVLVAIRLRANGPWPVIGMVTIALLGGANQIMAARSVPSAMGHGRMHVAFELSSAASCFGLAHAGTLLAFTLLPYVLLQAYRVRLTLY
ncbi:MAG TPA: hypothetical protein VGD59_05375 [Acidisarcina sp.]